MSEKLSIHCWNPKQGHAAMRNELWPMLKSMLMAGHRMVIDLRPASKSREQEAKYHVMVGEVAKQAQHLGSQWTPEDWKRLLLDKFARETGRTHGKVIPNLDKTGVVEVGILSRRFSVRDASDFVEWLHCWGAENGITYSDERVDPETGEIYQ